MGYIVRQTIEEFDRRIKAYEKRQSMRQDQRLVIGALNVSQSLIGLQRMEYAEKLSLVPFVFYIQDLMIYWFVS